MPRVHMPTQPFTATSPSRAEQGGGCADMATAPPVTQGAWPTTHFVLFAADIVRRRSNKIGFPQVQWFARRATPTNRPARLPHHQLSCEGLVGRSVAQAGYRYLGHRHAQRLNYSSPACCARVSVCVSSQQIAHLLQGSRGMINTCYHSVHFITQQSFAFY